jgi:PPE-repeat protein
VRAATVHPAAVVTIRNQLVSAVVSDLLGQNAPAIAAIEAEYEQMWAQDVSALFGYHAASSAVASALSPFTKPLAALAGLGGGVAGPGAALPPGRTSIFNLGFPNLGTGNVGSANVGLFNFGGGNAGNGNIGFGNRGDSNFGFGNTNVKNVGFGNLGSLNIGFGNNGTGNIGFGNPVGATPATSTPETSIRATPIPATPTPATSTPASTTLATPTPGSPTSVISTPGPSCPGTAITASCGGRMITRNRTSTTPCTFPKSARILRLTRGRTYP